MEKETANRGPALIKNLLDEEYVLIIGSETILEKKADKTQGTGDSNYLIYNAIAEKYALDYRPKTEQEWLHIIKSEGLGDALVCINTWEAIHNKKTKYYIESLQSSFSSELIEFLNFKMFRIIITTCIDNLLEDKLSTIWSDVGESLEVYNFQNNNDVLRFIKALEHNSKKKMSSMSPSLIYMFGKIGEKNTMGIRLPFVYTENDAIETIASYITKPGDNLKPFFEDFLFKHPVLSIGCRFDDWKFRFFWYAIRGTVSNFSNGTVAYTSSVSVKEDFLRSYLEQEQVIVESDSRAFLAKMNSLMKDKDVLLKVLDKRVKSAKGIFLSYASEDFETAYKWFDFLSSQCHFNVWIDREDLHANDVYTEEIKNNIDECGVFMPILSNQVVKDLTDGNFERYYLDVEWQHARDKEKTIFPVSNGEYEYNPKYHDIFKEKIGFNERDRNICSISTEKDKIVEALKEILLKLK